MKTILTLTTAALVILSYGLPASAQFAAAAGIVADDQGELDKRRKPRVPGGSGCDDPRDIIEHPECRG